MCCAMFEIIPFEQEIEVIGTYVAIPRGQQVAPDYSGARSEAIRRARHMAYLDKRIACGYAGASADFYEIGSASEISLVETLDFALLDKPVEAFVELDAF